MLLKKRSSFIESHLFATAIGIIILAVFAVCIRYTFQLQEKVVITNIFWCALAFLTFRFGILIGEIQRLRLVVFLYLVRLLKEKQLGVGAFYKIIRYVKNNANDFECATHAAVKNKNDNFVEVLKFFLVLDLLQEAIARRISDCKTPVQIRDLCVELRYEEYEADYVKILKSSDISKLNGVAALT